MRMVIADSYNILNTWKNYFCQLLNINNINDDRQTEIHTAEPLGHIVLSRFKSLLRS
jgi:hypothetical protein